MLKYLKANPAISAGMLAVFLMFLFTPGAILALIVVTLLILGYIYEHIKEDKEQHLDIVQTPKSGRYMSFEAKQEYLKSDEWSFLRSVILIRDNHKCVVCGATHNLQVHHITYERLGNEHNSDLATLCATHHQAIHDKLGYNQFKTYPIEVLDE